MQKVNIKNHRYIKYFLDLKYENNLLYVETYKLLKRVIKNNGNECLLLLNISNKCLVKKSEITSQSIPNEVNFSQSMINKLNCVEGNDKYAVIHNHPNGGTFTYMDIVQFFRYPRLKIMIACSNDCTEYFILYKNENANDKNLYKVSLKIQQMITNKGNGHDYFLPIASQIIANGVDYSEKIFIKGGNNNE